MLDIELEFLAQERVVKITTHGILDKESNKRLVAAGLAAGEKHGTQHFLVDHRDTTVALRIMDIYDLPKLNQRLGVKPDFRIALIYTPGQQSSGKFQYYEDLTVNAGLPQRVFTDERTALDWLVQG